MMDMNVLQSNASVATSTAATSASGADSNGDLISADFETFLKMMTAQVQNQDPMNPMDSSEYASQLATFSSVEQQVQTNVLLKQMGDLLGGGAIQQYGSWVGMDALARVPAQFTGEPIGLRADYADGADSAALVVRDENGDMVESFSIPVGQEQAIWTGLDPDGVPYAEGSYRFDVESYRGDELIGSTLASTYNQVEEIRTENGLVIVRLEGGIEVEATQVAGLRAAATDIAG